MRVAICSDTFLPQVNGVRNTLDKLLGYLEKEGHQYKVFAAGKDLNILMKAFGFINYKYKDKIHLLVVGDGPLVSNSKKKAPEFCACKKFVSDTRNYSKIGKIT